MALIIKGCLTIVTFGIKLPGKSLIRVRSVNCPDVAAGIFIPSLVVGACFGRIVGLSLQWIEWQYPFLWAFQECTGDQCIVPGLYAMVSDHATVLTAWC